MTRIDRQGRSTGTSSPRRTAGRPFAAHARSSGWPWRRAALAVTAFFAVAGPVAHAAGTHGGSHAGHRAASIGEPAGPARASRTVEVTMHDIYYEPASVRVSAGETVRFVVRNEGRLVHEFNIGTPQMHASHQAEMAKMVEHGVLGPDAIDRERMKAATGGGPTMAHDHPNSVLLAPGEAAEIVWRFTGAGGLEFACNVPGHYAAGMVGKILAE